RMLGAECGEVWGIRIPTATLVSPPVPSSSEFPTFVHFPRYERGVELYCGFWCVAEMPKGMSPPQWQHATWAVDIEGYTYGLDGIHMERSFKTEKQAREWFDYVTWCIEQLTLDELHKLNELANGKLT